MLHFLILTTWHFGNGKTTKTMEDERFPGVWGEGERAASRMWTFRLLNCFAWHYMGRCYCPTPVLGREEPDSTRRRLWGRTDMKTWLLYSISPKFETVLRNNLWKKKIFPGFHTRPAQAESWGGLGRHMHTFPCRIDHGLWRGKREKQRREKVKQWSRDTCCLPVSNTQTQSQGWDCIPSLQLTPTEGSNSSYTPRGSMK